ncbi:LOW QUALITY PROTEIN: terminal uridylyltransferase 4-like [Haliotis rubra]|uniref:LOW QUALITY PROTEIN: terminal uridylyltransferase 4-like n=1 Tax=Haliotis rubra TaxID=36100 RepID=UPI001EE60C5B|nr:LOW QUALITY PROTEIN: terminal uridylyltransferase 4-like [Haliotis rubra]
MAAQGNERGGPRRRRNRSSNQRPYDEGGGRNGAYDDPHHQGPYQPMGGGGGGHYQQMDHPPSYHQGNRPLPIDPRTGRPTVMPYQPHPQHSGYPGPSRQQSQGPSNPQNDVGGGQKKNRNRGKGREKQQQPQQPQQPQTKQQPRQQQQQQQQQQPKMKGNKAVKGQDQSSVNASSGNDGGSKNVGQQNKGVPENRKKGGAEDCEEKVDSSTLREMEKQKVFPLKKKSVKFPRAKFFCRLCEYHLDRVQDYLKHVSEPRHRRRKEVTDSENTLRYMPPPTKKQVLALDELLETIHADHGLTEEELQQRKDIVNRVEDFIHKHLPGVSLQMYGSSLTGFGLKSSDINIDLYSKDMEGLPKKLIQIFDILKTAEDQFMNVHSDFSAKVPACVFVDPDTKLECKMTINSRPATATSQLLAVYSEMDPRVRKLAVAFRYWAKVCRLDVQSEGTLPAYATALMTVFFLQQLQQPILPVLASNLPKNIDTDVSNAWVERMQEEAQGWKSKNTSSLGTLWLEVLRYFSLGFDTAMFVVCLRQQKMLARAEKKWNSKKLAIEDPFSQKRNVARTVSNTKIYEYFQDSLRKAYHYFGLPRSKEGGSLISNEVLSGIVEKSRGKKKHLGEFASADADDTDDDTDAARDSSVEPDDHEASDVTTGEGESSPERQLSDTLLSPSVNESCSSVSTLCEEDSSIISAGVSQMSLENLQEKPVDADIHTFARDFALKVVQSAVLAVSSSDTLSETCTSDVPSKSQGEEKGRCDGEDKCQGETTSVIKESEQSVNETKSGPILVDSVLKELNLEDKECFYEFTAKILTDGKGPAIICGYCEKEGHLKSACPEDQLPKLVTLPPAKKVFTKMLSVTIEQVPRDFGPTNKEMKQRDYILHELQDFIRQLYPGVILRLFGSSCNGFGFRMSDLDICMTFNQYNSAKDVKCTEIIEKLAKKLKEHRGLYQVVAIPTAKVPIVKFRHRESQLEADISLYNTLAQHNTKLLLTYSEIDPRVRALGYAFKVFAKVCDIGDASRGSLSSYAYVLMLLHYLQQCRPPVIPVLQELYHGKSKPEWMVDDCNAYFFENIDQLHKVWKDYGKNNMSIGELWLGLFRYYTEEFNYKERVVSIRQKAALTRFEKLWNGKCLAIEDPFDLNHNLGAGLSRKMNNYILKAFIHGRELYGTPKDEQLIGQIYRTLGDYCFDRSLLTEGTPPNDRGCRVCGKIGHIAKECPIVTNRKEREERERRQREERQREERQREERKREERARVNKKTDQPVNMALQHGMSPNTRPGNKSQSSPSTPAVSHMAAPPGFREKTKRSQSMPEGPSSTAANLQMSPPPGYQHIPILYDPQQQQIYIQGGSSSPVNIPHMGGGGGPLSPTGQSWPDQMSPLQGQAASAMHHGMTSSSLPMMKFHGQNNYVQVPLSQVLNVPTQSPPTPGQQIMMAISPQKQTPRMGHSTGMPQGPYTYGQPIPQPQMHSPPQHGYVQSPRVQECSSSSSNITEAGHTLPTARWKSSPKHHCP